MNVPEDTLTHFETQPPTVLVVDDNPTNLNVLSDYLGNEGFEILAARDGQTALKRAEFVKPDIILLDVMMPDMDGFETCRRLKAQESTRDIPVIFMTALSGIEDKVKGFQAGAIDYVTKPLQQEEVLARVHTHIKIRRLAQGLLKQNLRLATSSQVWQQVTSVLDLEELLVQVVKVIQSRFHYYFVGIWVPAEDKDTIQLRVGAGEDEKQWVTHKRRIPMNSPKSIIAWVHQTGQSYVSDDVQLDPRYLSMEEFPHTQSELVVPLRVGGEEVIGVLDIQSQETAAFSPEDQSLLEMLASQIAVAMRNAHLYELEKRLRYMEEERVQALAKLNADKDKFFAIVAHDLRSPFNPLINLTKLLLSVPDDTPARELKSIGRSISSSATTLYDLLENLLNWSRLERGLMPYDPQSLDLRKMTDRTVKLFAENVATKGVILSNQIPAGTMVCADEHMLDTILRNLVSNAIKFTASGGEILVLAVPQAQPEPSIAVSVKDSGVGIKEEDIDKLLRSDSHHSTAGTQHEKGTGLGLGICKEMVERHGGQFWLESELGKGTTVAFTLPLANGTQS